MWSLSETHITSKDKQVERKMIEKIFHTNDDENRAGVATLISNKIDLNSKKFTRDKEDVS